MYARPFHPELPLVGMRLSQNRFRGAKDELKMYTWDNMIAAALDHGVRRADAECEHLTRTLRGARGRGAQRRQGAHRQRHRSRRLLKHCSNKSRETRAESWQAGPGPRPSGCLAPRGQKRSR